MAKYKNKFSDKRYSVGGFISTAMAATSVAMLCVAVITSYKARGNGGKMVGAYALTALLVAFFGCLLGLISYKEVNRIYTFSFIGTLCCGIMTVLMVFLLLVGL